MANVIGSGTGTAGAFVAMDPRNGRVLAMGSFPTFDPSVLARPITQARYNAIFGPKAGAPDFNRAIAGAYPTGSTFKPITAIAALREGHHHPRHAVDDPGVFTAGTQKFYNAGKVANGVVSLRRAIQISSDVFFYTARQRGQPARARDPDMGAQARPRPPDGDRHPRRGRRHDPRPRLARAAERQGDRLRAQAPHPVPAQLPVLGQAPVVGRRQHPARGRPGRRAGDAAADGDRLRRARERRDGRAPAPRARGRERHGQPAAADRHAPPRGTRR